MADEVAVSVVVRVRPLIERERANNAVACVRCVSDTQVVLGKDKPFTFDRVLPPACSQDDVFGECVAPLIGSLFDGYHATVFAYGQTNSGKTFTMGTSVMQEASAAPHVGIIPRSLQAVFEHIQHTGLRAVVSVSFIEIYNEDIYDLLHPETSTKLLSVREDPEGHTYVANLHEQPVSSAVEALQWLEYGSVYRTTGATQMNEESSRSHAIFSVGVRFVSGHSTIASKLHLVDLAGSERNKRALSYGRRFREAVHINGGLLALGNVISALADDKRRLAHVPYRESKLTRILKDALGGNSRTLMIACLSPADVNFEETHNTLKYANRAKNIRNKPVINREAEQLESLQRELESLRAKLSAPSVTAPAPLEPAPQSDADAAALAEAERLMNEYRSELEHTRRRLQLKDSELRRLSADLARAGTIVRNVAALLVDGRLVVTTGDRELIDDLHHQLCDYVNDTGLPTFGDVPKPVVAVAGTSTPEAAELSRRFAELKGELESTRAALAEAREDLTINEEVFGTKQREFLKLARSYRELKRSKAEADVELSQLRGSAATRPTTAGSEAPPPIVPEISFSQAAPDSPPSQFSNRFAHDSQLASPQRLVSSKHNSTRLLESQVDEADEVQVSVDMSATHGSNEARDVNNDTIGVQVQQVEREFAEYKEFTDQKLRELHFQINLKEQFVHEILRQQQEQSETADRRELLDNRLRRTVEALQSADVDRHALATATAPGEKDAQLASVETRLQDALRELASVQHELEQHDRIYKLQKQSERRIRDLEQQVTALKNLEGDLKDRLLEEEKRYKHTLGTLNTLRREREKHLKRIAQLERGAPAGTGPTTPGVAATLPPLSARSGATPRSLAEQRKWLAAQVEAATVAREQAEQLKRQLECREATLAEREQIASEKLRLETKKMRRSQALEQSVVALTARMGSVDAEMERTQVEMAVKGAGDEALSSLKARLSSLESQRVKLRDELAQIEATRAQVDVLEPEQEEALRHYGDMLDTLNAELEFQNDAIKRTQAALGRPEGDLLETLTALEPAESRGLLSSLVEQHVNVLIALRKEQQSGKELQSALNEHKSLVEELRRTSALLQQQRASNLRDSLSGTASAEQIRAAAQTVVTEAPASSGTAASAAPAAGAPSVAAAAADATDDDQLRMLREDNNYYRQLNRKFKQQLRDVINANAVTKRALAAEQERVKQLSAEVAQLKATTRS